jgi:peptide/nickel transport system permease protein
VTASLGSDPTPYLGTTDATSPQSVATPEVRLRKQKRPFGALVGATWILVVICVAVLAPVLPLPSPDALGTSLLSGPTWEHPFGTDSLGSEGVRCSV